MRVLREPTAIAAIDDPALRQLIEQRIGEISESEPYNADDHGHFVIVEPGDRVEVLEAETGCAILSGRFNEARFGDDDFSPSFEWLEEHDGYYEAVYILSDSGFGIDLLIPKQAGIDAELLAMCATYAAPASPAGDKVEPPAPF